MATGRTAPPVQFRGRSLRGDKSWFEGTHRAVSPRETLARLQPLLADLGITRIADISGLDRVGLPVALAIRPNARTLSVSSGKGLDWPAAAASAAMEAFELHHAEHAELPVVNGSLATIRQRYPIIPPELLWRRGHSLFHESMPIDWTFGWDILNQQEVAIPLPLVALRPVGKGEVHHRAAAFARDTNGLASGNHFLEALCTGLYEVIERDAWGCHLHAADAGRHRVPKLDLAAIGESTVRCVLERFMANGLEVHLFDCSLDTRVPTYRAVVCDPALVDIPIADGYGAHLDPVIALLRALTEAAQSRTVAISGSRDDMFDIHHGNVAMKALQDRIDRFGREPGTADPGALSNGAGASFEADVNELLARLSSVGIKQVIAVDLTNTGTGLCALKVVVPGLEACRSRGWVPGPRARRFAARHAIP